jgi:predicted Zn-dependent peptidase
MTQDTPSRARENVALTTLPSGLRVVTDSMAGLETTSLGVWVHAGSRDEAADEHGIAHLLEHMAFKGTRRRSARQIAEAIEAVGGDLNAETTFEHTSYLARMLAGDVPLAIDILSDILLEPALDPEELAREKAVIIQEIGAYEDSPEDLVHDWLTEAAFPGQPIGRPILGTEQSVSSFSPGSVRGFLDRHYRSPHAVVAAAGVVDHARFVAEVGEAFARLPAAAAPSASAARYCGGEMREGRDLEQAHIVLGFGGRSFHDDGYWATQLFTSAVGGGMSSPLFQEIREKRGLAYSVYSFHWPFTDTGVFGIYVGTSERDAGDAVRLTLDTLAEATMRLSEADMSRAKAQMRIAILGALEAPASRVEQIARHVMAFGRVLSRAELVDRIDSLTLEDLRTGGALLLATPPTLAAIGPVDRVPSVVSVAERVGAPQPGYLVS